MSSGAIDIMTAAEITEKFTPFSGALKIQSPTVNGRVSSLLVTIESNGVARNVELVAGPAAGGVSFASGLRRKYWGCNP